MKTAFERAQSAVKKALGSPILQQYHPTCILGLGGNGVVLRCMDKTGPVAVKLIYRTALISTPNEILLLKSIKNKNLLEFICDYEDGDFWYLVTDCCIGQESIVDHNTFSLPVNDTLDLYALLDHYGQLPLKIIKRLFFGILQGIEAVHQAGWAHCDIKEENILIQSNFNVKICDFGHAQMTWPPRVFRYGTDDLTPPELLPNLWSGFKKNQCIMVSGKEADMWALGLLLFTLTQGNFPAAHKEFLAGSVNSQHFQSYSCCYRLPIHPVIQDLIEGMLSVDPSTRLTIEEAVQHEWFTCINE